MITDLTVLEQRYKAVMEVLEEPVCRATLPSVPLTREARVIGVAVALLAGAGVSNEALFATGTPGLFGCERCWRRLAT